MPFYDAIRVGAAGAGDYEIERSLKFNDDDTAYLSRDFGSGGNRKKWTFSAWIKRGNLAGSAGEMRIFGGDTNASHIFFPTNDEITWDVAAPGSSASGNLNTTQVSRDPSAWFHLVCALDTDESTADNRMRMYVNGAEITDFGSRTNPSSGYALNAINADGDRATHTLGYRTSAQGSAGMEFDGYMAEIHFIDGQQYDASYFAETDAVTGEYKPKKYTGGYGTTGFYLNFSDNSGTTATTLGKDSSGNSNNWTPNNFSVAAGVGNDSLTDTPTNNFCTFNPLKVNVSAPIVFSEGLLQHNGVSGNNHLRSATTMQVTSGKWYVEFKFISGYETLNGTVGFGICTDAGHRDSNNDAAWYENSNNFLALQYRNDGEVVRSQVATSTDELTGLSTFVNGDVMGLALDLDNDKFFVSKNGTWFSNGTGTQDPANGTNPLYSGGVLTSRKSDGFYFNISGYSAQVVTADFGQHGYAYTPPTGFKAVNTANLSDPSIAEGDKHFNTLVFTGNQSTNARTGLDFQPDWVVYKALNPESGHGETKFHDSVRGSTKGQGIVQYNSTTPPAEVTNSSYLVSFDSNGLTVGSDGVYDNYQTYNQTGRTYQALCWKGGGSASSNSDGSITSSVSANTTAGFSIVSYTGTGSSATVGHGLGVKPDVMIIKNRNSEGHGFLVYHTKIGATKNLQLNLNDPEATASNKFNDTEPTSSVFTVNTSADGNQSGQSMIAYCFSEVAGYSKFGSYTGNGNNAGPFAYCGFEPAFVLIKRSSSGDNNPWIGYNNVRNPINLASNQMVWNTTQWENIDCDNCNLDFLSNGFKLRNSDGSFNGNGGTYVFLAFANSPFKYARAR